MKKYLAIKSIKRTMIVTVAAYLFVYVCYSFTVFEFKNPFQWIINIPTYQTEERFGIMVGFLMYYGISFFAWHDHFKAKKGGKNES